MSERDRPFVRAGSCLVCKLSPHDRVLDYDDLSHFLKQKVATLKTWVSLQNTWLEKTNSKNPDIAERMLQRAVNNRAAGTPMYLSVDYHGTRRVFRPLPPMIAPARWCGHVISVYLYQHVLLSASYDVEEHITQLNLRKQIDARMPAAGGASALRGAK
jgi:hypothetical protein